LVLTGLIPVEKIHLIFGGTEPESFPLASWKVEALFGENYPTFAAYADTRIMQQPAIFRTVDQRYQDWASVDAVYPP
jgi:hypothetical protein